MMHCPTVPDNIPIIRYFSNKFAPKTIISAFFFVSLQKKNSV